jgi:hypothetical protein
MMMVAVEGEGAGRGVVMRTSSASLLLSHTSACLSTVLFALSMLCNMHLISYIISIQSGL